MVASSSGNAVTGTLGRGQLYPLDNYKKGTAVWVRHDELIWARASLIEDVTFGNKLIRIQLGDGQVIELPNVGPESLPFLCNPDILIGRDDLTELSYLHEPAVLYNLHCRFVDQRQIYTYCGIVLVAINPYEDTSHLYGHEIIQVYSGSGKSIRSLVPHIYGVAEEAYFDMREYGKNQSIIVSGESGAGKTVSAKYAMNYFAKVASSRGQKNAIGIEDRVLASNPIMEAFGNAKTLRNDNSSRFGKFIQINFTDRFAILGAEMKTYLLEKSRLVFQARNERNYHIFYQICAARSHALLKDLHLDASTGFSLTSQGGDGRIPRVNDAFDFEQTANAFSVLGMSKDDLKAVCQVLAGLLHLGNVNFTSMTDREDASTIDGKFLSGPLCNDLWRVDWTNLLTWLTNREIKTGGETIRTPLNVKAAVASRDSLAKTVYSALFNWIVQKVNSALVQQQQQQHHQQQQQHNSQSTAGGGKPSRFIGVLDIYGFETFDINSFEQFCINYANEKLQQQFCQHVFKLEQEEYVREELAWIRIDFYDNQPCIDLIEDKLGLIDLLDEQCRVGRGTDLDWLQQLRNSRDLKTKPHFQLPKIQQPSFIVRHFAADVTYRVDGFLDKNKDTVSEQLLNVIRESQFSLLREILGDDSANNNNNNNNNQQDGMSLTQYDTGHSSVPRKQTKKTVSCQFRDSLSDLMATLCSTRPHYVRCIKPNDDKSPYTFHSRRAIEQLRACGVLETVRISAEGYPSRWLYEDFGKRYRVLYTEGKALWRDQAKKFTEKTCQKWIKDECKYALGKTKVFFRTGQVATLERVREETLARSVLVIQKTWRGYLARKHYKKLRQAVLTIQAACRAYMAYRHIKYLQMHRAAICLQTKLRGWVARVRYQQIRKAILGIQTIYRAKVVRARIQKLRYQRSVIVIQAYCRGWLVRRHRIAYVRCVVTVQACVRRWLARRRLKELKIEARSVGHLQKLNKGLENKIWTLQQKLDIVTAENLRLSHECGRIPHMEAELSLYGEAKIELGSLSDQLYELRNEVERLATECDVKDAQVGEAQLKVTEVQAKLDMKTNAFENEREKMEREKKESDENVQQLNKLLKERDSHIAEDQKRLDVLEAENHQQKEQLMSNANMLASPAFSRAGSIRRSLSPHNQMLEIGSSANLDRTELLLTIQQQRLITKLSQQNDRLTGENEKLKAIMEANSLVERHDRKAASRAYECQRLQELEVAYAKMKSEVGRLLEEKAKYGAANMDVQSMFERIVEENDRRREESAGLRGLLVSRFEQQIISPGSNSNNNNRPDSGIHSSSHSDDEGGLYADIDDELCMDRQCREQKAVIQHLSEQVEERDTRLLELEKKLAELFDSQEQSSPNLLSGSVSLSDSSLSQQVK